MFWGTVQSLEGSHMDRSLAAGPISYPVRKQRGVNTVLGLLVLSM